MSRPPQKVENYPCKSPKLSIKHRNDGNAMYKRSNFFEALEFYNKSLMAAETKSVEISLAYANRSAVYLEVKEFQLCLDNIQLAIDSSYPVEKLQTLKDREEKCKKMMQSEVNSDEDDPCKFFKLSYPANKKIPFIAECLELREDKKFGRHIVTNRDLQPGDIIAIVKPFFHNLHPHSEHLRCTECMKSNKMNLIPHETNPTVMFCSIDCKAKAEFNYMYFEKIVNQKKYHQRNFYKSLAICSSKYENLQQLMVDPKFSNKTIFDFDFSDSDDPLYKIHQLIAFNGLLQAPVDPEDENIIAKNPSLLLFLKKNVTVAITDYNQRLKRITALNSCQFDWSSPKIAADKFLVTANETVNIGAGVCLFGSLLNHSCVPNIDRILIDNKLVFSVRRPIVKGQQLLTSYGVTFVTHPKIQRQIKLLNEFGFICSCEACEGNYQQPKGGALPLARISLARSLSITEHNKNCMELAKNQKHPSDIQMWILMNLNDVLRAAIGKNEPFIF